MRLVAILFAPLTAVIAQPWLALLPAAVFAALYGASKRPLAAAAAVLWLLYGCYEYAMYRRWLCTGECNIRIDRLLLYPVLLLVSLAAGIAGVRGARRRRESRPRGSPWSAVFLSCLLWLFPHTVPATAQGTRAAELAIFKTWLDREHPGYACDEGPARFRNATVDAAYPGRRFYYVLTYTRGMRPRFPNELSLVVHVDGNGTVTPLDRSSPATYRPGLRKVFTEKDARQAAAAVLILALGDPGEGRFQEHRFAVKRSRKGWVCTYPHGRGHYTSQVTFDKHGVLSAISANPPPVG